MNGVHLPGNTSVAVDMAHRTVLEEVARRLERKHTG